jgi:hypothetical protein
MDVLVKTERVEYFHLFLRRRGTARSGCATWSARTCLDEIDKIVRTLL